MSEHKSEHQKKNNKGFTLIEVLVVLAIVAIVTAMAGITISVVNNSNVSKAATRFDSMLSRARSESIARGTEAGKLTITCESGKVYGQIGSFDKELICNSQISVYYGCSGSGSLYSYEETSFFVNNASTYQLKDGDSYSILFLPSGVATTDDTGLKLTKLMFVRGNKKVQVILYRQTGKHEVTAF